MNTDASQQAFAPLYTARLTLLPFTRDLIKITMRNKAGLARLLHHAVPEDWPGPDLEGILPFLDDAVASKPARAAWIRIVAHTADRVLIGSAGFIDEPDASGSVEFGYSLIASYRGQGYATEAGRTLLDFAFTHGVKRVRAECLRDNAPSIRVLERLGMAGTGRDGQLLQWEKLNPEGE